MAEKFPYFYLLLLEGRPSVELPKKGIKCDHDPELVEGACDGTDATSLISHGWHSPLQKSPFPPPGWTERKKGRGGRPCMAFLDRVSEGQLNERLMNAAGSDEPIIRRPSVSFLSKNHSPYLHHDTDSKFLWRRTRSFLQYSDGNGNQKHDRSEIETYISERGK